MSINLPNAPIRKPRVIILGNEKGGSGKSTAAMHLIVGLLHAGHRVGSMDVDSRQATLTRYIDNRRATLASKGVSLPMSDHRRVDLSKARGEVADADERERFDAALAELAAHNDVVVIDTPGSDTFLSRLAHSHADTIVTPMNDSFVDLDLIAKVDPDTLKVTKPSLYAEMVWEQRKQRALRDRSSIDWVVMKLLVGANTLHSPQAPVVHVHCPEAQVLQVDADGMSLDLLGQAFTTWREPCGLRVVEAGVEREETFPACDAYALMVEAVSARSSGQDAWVLPLSTSAGVAATLDAITRAPGGE